MISHDDAYTKLLSSLQTNKRSYENVPLALALGRILARPVIAKFPSPRFATAAMDGYAIIADDQYSSSPLTLTSLLPAGTQATQTVTNGTCIKTFTGSMMSPGANTLIPIENVTVTEGMVQIHTPVKEGFAVRQIAEDYDQGDILIPQGLQLSFPHIGMLASLGHPMACVTVRPRVAVLSTGSEILDLGEEATNPSQIRSANNYMIEALCNQAGASVRQMGIMGDDKEMIRETLQGALESNDIIITTGGVSVGDFDFVKEIILEWEGASLLFKGVAIKPGQHITVAQIGSKYFFGLPGFSYSAIMTAFIYIVPMIRALQGLEPHIPRVKGYLTTPYTKKHTKTEFTPCRAVFQNNRYEIDFEGKKMTTSANITTLLDPKTAIMILDETTSHLDAGSWVDVILLSGACL